MTTCPNCNHQNPDGALQCEACYTPLPVLIACPSCHTPIQSDASFCGQCGYDLRDNAAATTAPTASVPESSIPTQNFSASSSNLDNSELASSESELSSPLEIELPDLLEPDPLIVAEPLGSELISPELISPEPLSPETSAEANAETLKATEAATGETTEPLPPAMSTPASPANATQIQTLSARLRQAQTDTLIEIPRQLSVIRIGKPNDQTPPDIDVSGFPDSEVVSRVHANLRVEGDTYYLEDVGSANGTYINGLPLPTGNRHRLRPGDRIALGKGDKVSFIFETA